LAREGEVGEAGGHPFDKLRAGPRTPGRTNPAPLFHQLIPIKGIVKAKDAGHPFRVNSRPPAGFIQKDFILKEESCISFPMV
jgi:hypothetical protein